MMSDITLTATVCLVTLIVALIQLIYSGMMRERSDRELELCFALSLQFIQDQHRQIVSTSNFLCYTPSSPHERNLVRRQQLVKHRRDLDILYEQALRLKKDECASALFEMRKECARKYTNLLHWPRVVEAA